ncbi:MAG TPA: DUF3078 domain-containing protein [Saprospiraceae bacterium]|nr:DUF3078 domain-containing protein [Saprospiraceae bacterium]
MKKNFLLVSLLTLVVIKAWSQNDDASRLAAIVMAEEDSTKTWATGGGIGADLGNILIINPKPGSGQNRIGFGGAIGFFANHLKNRFSWDNNVSLNFAVEKTGSGILPIPNAKIRIPFKKSIDDLRLNSTAGYKVSANSQFSYAADLAFRSQFTPAYIGVEDGQIYTKSIQNLGPYRNYLVSQFFSPARASFGLGMKYDPTPVFSVVFTPATADVIIIENQYIANLGLHGTELKEGSTTEYEKTRLGIGAKLSIKYMQNFFDEKLAWSSRLSLFSDYMHDPQNVDVDWTNELAFTIFRNIQFGYLSNLYYDDDILSHVTDFDAVGGLKRDSDGDPIVRSTINYYHQIVLKYARVF